MPKFRFDLKGLMAEQNLKVEAFQMEFESTLEEIIEIGKNNKVLMEGTERLLNSVTESLQKAGLLRGSRGPEDWQSGL